MTGEEQKLGSLKPSRFAPKVPQRRKAKVEPVKAEKKERPVYKKKERVAPVLVASGPFALGPNQRNSRPSSAISAPSSTSYVKREDVPNEYEDTADLQADHDLAVDDEDRALPKKKVPLSLHHQLSTDAPPETLFFVQLPSILPQTNESLIGNLITRQSGRISIEIGGVEFDVTETSEALVPQWGSVVKDGKMVWVGECGRRLVCTPDLEKLLI